MTLKKPPTISVFAVLVTLCTAALIFFCLRYPLLGSLGAESGLLFGAIIGPLMYMSGSIRGAYRDDRGFGSDLVHEFAVAIFALCLFVAALIINSFFVTSCAPARGFGPFATHAIPVVCFDLVCGLLLGRIVGSRLFAYMLAILVGAGYVIARLFLWWQNPSFRFLSHPFVALDGDLLHGAGLAPEIIGYRVATLLFALALILLGTFLFSSSQRTGFGSERSSALGSLLPMVVLLLLGIGMHIAVTDVLEPSVDDRIAVISRETRRGQFVVHSDPHKTSPNDADAILAEASLWASRLKTRMGDVLASDIHIWLYPDTDTLSRFTGAANVHFALPAHREIHIVGAEIPHPTLGHEIAHILVGEKASTLIGVPGIWGFLPNQGLTEGMAMMLTPELSTRAELTLAEQAAALTQSEGFPDLKSLFSVSPLAFFAHNTSMAYSVAGAYLAELTNTKGQAALLARLAYAGDIDAAFDSPEERAKFDDAFILKLKTMLLPKDAIPSVAALFGKPPVLSSTCEDVEKEEPFLSDPLLLAQRFEKQATNTTSRELTRKQLALEDAADHYWRANRPKQATDLWRQIQLDVLPPNHQRQCEAKALFAASPTNTLPKRALDYLVYNDEREPRARAAALLLGMELNKRDTEAEDGTPSATEIMASYLSLRVRILATGGASDISALERLSSNKLLPPSFQLESMRVIALARALGSKPLMAADQFRNLASLNARSAFSLQMLDFAERAERIATAQALEEGHLLKSDTWLLGTRRFDQ